jgi:alpha-amylase
MTQPIRLVLALHNHQPIGNFDDVFEQAYRDSYKPFLDVFEGYANLRMSLHTSGSLMEWLQQHHREYVDRLAYLVAAGRIEILGGAFFEAILPMIPRRDRIGQIRSYTDWLQRRLGAEVRGMWIPERVWEQSLVSDLAQAGIQYTLLDDFHFKNAGLSPEQLHGHYVSEDDGYLVSIFPGSERLRYIIPFGQPQETIDYLGQIAGEHPDAVVVFGDDGEKFGTWPETKKHVYEDGWLVRFFDALAANQHWIHTTTLGEAVDNVPPIGKIYLPDSSYREMTEWALPVAQLTAYDQVRNDMERDPRWPELSKFVRGGNWRNFKVKYPETDEMYTRMLMVSNRLAAAEESSRQTPSAVRASVESAPLAADGARSLPATLDRARAELYRGQCNCSYWHGAFGGIYLPHLRNSVYRSLIAAENLLDQAAGRTGPWVEASVADFNLDARQEVFLANDRLALLLAPVRGGQMYELDVRDICHNLLATLTRRPEAYHEKILNGGGGKSGRAASIHEKVVFKQAGLEQRLQYDSYARKSLLDHFYDNDATLETVAGGQAWERGDFLAGVYEARLRRAARRIEVQLTREGNAWGYPFRITKSVLVEAGSPTVEVEYRLEGLPQGRPLHFAIEMNFAGLPAGADDRYFHNGQGQRLGQLGNRLNLTGAEHLGMVDEYLGIDVGLHLSRPSGLWTFPIETVSQSEGGFELVHQSIAVLPHWIVEPDAAGNWSVTLHLTADTSLAESRRPLRTPALAAT